MENVDLLLTHALVVTQDKQRTIIPDGLIAIHNERILAVDSFEELKERYVSKETIDLHGQIVFPGLINTHDHF